MANLSFDFNKIKRTYFNVKLKDGTVLQVKMPTKNTFGKVQALNRLQEDENADVADVMDTMAAVMADCLSNNLNGVKTVSYTHLVSLKAGLMTLIGDTIEKLCDTARVAVSEDGKYRRTKIGGVGNRKGAKYVICFHHVDPEDGDIWVCLLYTSRCV